MGSGASFYLVSKRTSYWLSRKPSLKTRLFRGFKLRSHRSSPYLPAGKAKGPPCCLVLVPLLLLEQDCLVL